MKSNASVRARRGRLAVLALLACGAFLGSGASSAGAALPNILNTASGCPSQTTWLVSCTTGGTTNNGANVARVTVWSSHDTDKSLASLLTDDDWDGNTFTTRTVSAQRPAINGGYPRSRANLSWTFGTGGTGMDCPTFSGGTRATSDRVLRMQARDSASQTQSGTTDSMIRFIAAANCANVAVTEDYPFLYDVASGNFGKVAGPGQGGISFTYNGDDPDSGSNEDFEGVRYRWRDLRTGQVVGGEVTHCPSNGDNNTKTTTVTAPDRRGAYVVEAELRNANDCSQNDRNDWWWALGTVDVNSSAAPTADFSATRPQWNGSTTATVNNFDDPDSDHGGGVQIVEWDLNNWESGGTTDGVSGFEGNPLVGGYGNVLSGSSRTINTTGMSPGVYTVRTRLTDNGAGDAADSIRRTRILSTTFRVDSAPTANAQTVNTETNATNVPITLTGSDPDDDTLTYTITDPPDHGTLGGSGASRTYTPTAGYAGTDSFTFQVDDGFGRTDTAVVSINVRPETEIDTTPSALSNDNTPTFTFSSNATNSGTLSFECSLNTGSSTSVGFSACNGSVNQANGTGSHTYGTLSDGSYNFRVRAVAGGQTDPDIESNQTFAWTIDATKPIVDIDDASKPANPTNQQTASFTFSSNESGSFQCRLDGDPPGGTGWESCGSGTTGSKAYNASQLDEDDHTFQVRQTDAAGNTSDPDGHTWTIDITAPNVTIDNGSKPANPTNVQTADFTFSANEAGDFECRLDGDAPGGTGWVDCGDGTSGSKSYTSSDLDEGSHTFEVRSTDAAGNTDQTPATYAWVVDLTAPTIQIDTRPGDPTNATSASFTFSAVQPNPEAGDFECKLDTPSTTGTFAGCGSNATSGSQTYANLNEEGVYTFTVKSTDAAGNTSTEQTYSWTIDLTPPFTSITQAPTDSDPGTSPDRSKDPTPEFEFNSDPGSTFQCRLDPPNGPPSAYAPCNDGTFETPDLTGAGFGEGQYLFEVFATDPAGNPGTAASHVWVFDQTPPSNTGLTGPNDPTNSTNATFNFTFNERGSFDCKLDGGTFAPCDTPGPGTSGTQAYTGLSEGNHTFRVKSTDSAGNTSLEAVYTWEVDVTAPVNTSLTGPADPTKQTSAAFNFAFDEAGTFQCKLDGGSFSGCGSGTTGSRTFAGPLAQGEHTFTVRSTDAANNTSLDATHTWVVDTTAPTVQITGGPTGTVPTDDASFTFTAADNPSPNSGTGPVAAQCKLDNGAFVDCTSPVSYNDLPDGPHTVTVQGTDEAGNQHSDFRTWTVDTTPPETTITSDPGAVNPSPEASFAFTSSEAGSTYACSLDGGPWQACTSPKDYSGLSDGEHNFRVRATDPVGNTDLTPDAHDWLVGEVVLGESSQGPKVVPRTNKPNVKADGRFRVGQVQCPNGTGPCEVTKKRARVKVGGETYNARVVVSHLVGDGKNAAVWVILPRGARESLYEAGRALLTWKVLVKGENGTVEKFAKKMGLSG